MSHHATEACNPPTRASTTLRASEESPGLGRSPRPDSQKLGGWSSTQQGLRSDAGRRNARDGQIRKVVDTRDVPRMQDGCSSNIAQHDKICQYGEELSPRKGDSLTKKTREPVEQGLTAPLWKPKRRKSFPPLPLMIYTGTPPVEHKIILAKLDTGSDISLVAESVMNDLPYRARKVKWYQEPVFTVLGGRRIRIKRFVSLRVREGWTRKLIKVIFGVVSDACLSRLKCILCEHDTIENGLLIAPTSAKNQRYRAKSSSIARRSRNRI